ncbi:hypothetical protein [Gimesia aquarii]|uniref:Uncharacterized protein n=1 Tax=Gimesia aquarii TaxID=2527964 RepID=A0A517WQ56_9PLAN|nr:hypothetical protein [Gimesia aquarii]QDU07374.1 hypothetical protein V202x_07270 [Gimesia aquarii]
MSQDPLAQFDEPWFQEKSFRCRDLDPTITQKLSRFIKHGGGTFSVSDDEDKIDFVIVADGTKSEKSNQNSEEPEHIELSDLRVLIPVSDEVLSQKLGDKQNLQRIQKLLDCPFGWGITFQDTKVPIERFSGNKLTFKNVWFYHKHSVSASISHAIFEDCHFGDRELNDPSQLGGLNLERIPDQILVLIRCSGLIQVPEHSTLEDCQFFRVWSQGSITIRNSTIEYFEGSPCPIEGGPTLVDTEIGSIGPSHIQMSQFEHCRIRHIEPQNDCHPVRIENNLFQSCDFRSQVFGNLRLENNQFESCDFEHTIWFCVDMQECQFTNCSLNNIRWIACRFTENQLVNTTLPVNPEVGKKRFTKATALQKLADTLAKKEEFETKLTLSCDSVDVTITIFLHKPTREGWVEYEATIGAESYRAKRTVSQNTPTLRQLFSEVAGRVSGAPQLESIQLRIGENSIMKGESLSTAQQAWGEVITFANESRMT